MEPTENAGLTDASAEALVASEAAEIGRMTLDCWAAGIDGEDAKKVASRVAVGMLGMRLVGTSVRTRINTVETSFQQVIKL